MYYEYMFST